MQTRFSENLWDVSILGIWASLCCLSPVFLEIKCTYVTFTYALAQNCEPGYISPCSLFMFKQQNLFTV